MRWADGRQSSPLEARNSARRRDNPHGGPQCRRPPVVCKCQVHNYEQGISDEDEHTPQTDVLQARAAISTIIEPGDGVAGTLIDALGPVAAYDAITGNGLQAALQDAGVGERTAQESISRWTPRISSSVIAHNLASLERANVTLIDPDTIPALSDLGAQRPVALYVRGNASLLTTPRPYW